MKFTEAHEIVVSLFGTVRGMLSPVILYTSPEGHAINLADTGGVSPGSACVQDC